MVITIEAINFNPLKVNISKQMAVLTDLVLYALTARVNAGHSIPDKLEDSWQKLSILNVYFEK